MAVSFVTKRRVSPDRTRAVAIAMLNEADFYRLKSRCPTLRLPDRYDDWRDERDGLLVGLSAAGMRTVPVPVDLEKFLAACAADPTALDDSALDRFAASTQYNVSPRGDFALLAERAPSAVTQRIGSLN